MTESPVTGLEVIVDMGLCDSHGQCVCTAPQVFAFDEDDVLVYEPDPDASQYGRPAPTTSPEPSESAFGRSRAWLRPACTNNAWTDGGRSCRAARGRGSRATRRASRRPPPAHAR